MVQITNAEYAKLVAERDRLLTALGSLYNQAAKSDLPESNYALRNAKVTLEDMKCLYVARDAAVSAL